MISLRLWTLFALLAGLFFSAGCARQTAAEKPAGSTENHETASAPATVSAIPVEPARINPPIEAPAAAPTPIAATETNPSPASTPEVPAVLGGQGGSATSAPAKPYIRLTTRSKGTLIVAADFQGVLPQLEAMKPDEKREFLLQACVDLATENQLEQEEGISQLKIYALLIANSHEYHPGSFKGVTQLAIIEAETGRVADTAREVSERVANVKWIDKSLQR